MKGLKNVKIDLKEVTATLNCNFPTNEAQNLLFDTYRYFKNYAFRDYYKRMPLEQADAEATGYALVALFGAGYQLGYEKAFDYACNEIEELERQLAEHGLEELLA